MLDFKENFGLENGCKLLKLASINLLEVNFYFRCKLNDFPYFNRTLTLLHRWNNFTRIKVAYKDILQVMSMKNLWVTIKITFNHWKKLYF